MTPERIQHTVWKEILSPDFNSGLESPLASSNSSEAEDDEDLWSVDDISPHKNSNSNLTNFIGEQNSVIPPTAISVQLDTVELERLFKKTRKSKCIIKTILCYCNGTT